jgi:hypothetical protein
VNEQFCANPDCRHSKGNHTLPGGGCNGEIVRDKNGAITQRNQHCKYKKFVVKK